MLNHNRAPKLVTFGAVVALGPAALGLAGCTDKSGSDRATSAPSTKPSFVGDDIPPKDLATCKGKLDGFKLQEGFTKDGPIYEVTSISEGSCASVYDLTTRKDIGGLVVGDEFIGGCTFDDKPARIHVLAPITTGDTVGDVNLTEAGVPQAGAVNMQSCASEGTPDKGFFIPS